MVDNKSKEDEFHLFLGHYSDFIRIHILKFNLHKRGLDPDDIIQEVRIKLWKLISSEKIISNYPSYIKKIVNSSVIDQLRKFRREENIFIYEKNRFIAEAEFYNSPEFVRLKNLEDAVGKAILLLRDSRRQVVKLYLLNMNITEISSYFKWTNSKTRNLLYRGLSDLRNILKKMGISA